MAITLTTEDEIDINRGDMIVHTKNIPSVSNKFKAMVVWFDEVPLEINKTYSIKRATTLLTGFVKKIDYKVDVNTYQKEKVDKLNLNEQQVKKFDDIIFNQRKTAIDTKAELQKLQLKLRKMMNDNTVDENKLYGITDKISDLRSKRQKSRISTWLKIYNILDKEQKPLWTKAF
jgi:sulfate adenylyltransferase subunit 1 (EFTu-like GTPase family)